MSNPGTITKGLEGVVAAGDRVAAPAVALFIAEYPDHGYPITVRLMADGE